MKNYLTFALMIGATASMAFGQTARCEGDGCHVAPYFKGEGGFVGEKADGYDEVTFVVDCGRVNTTGTAPVNDDGIASQRLAADVGLDCADGGTVEIVGLKDGGWYWINDTMNSAVASLVRKDALGNDMVMPTNPGSPDITLESMEGGATTILKEVSTGRIGILHHVLPEAPAAPATLCGPRYHSGSRVYWSQQSGCMLGDGGTAIAVTGPSNSVGLRQRVTNGVVYRPVVAGETVTVSFGLWGNGSGHVSTEAGSTSGHNSAAALRGWDMKASGGHVPESFAADFTVDLPDAPNATLASAGISEVMNGPVLEETTPDEVVLGHFATGETAATAPSVGTTADSRADNNIAVATDDTIDAAVDNGFGMFGGQLTYCTQKADERTGGAGAVLYFAGASGGTVMVTVDGSGAALDAQGASLGLTNNLTGTASWADQATWATEWNGQAANADLIKRNTLTETANDDAGNTTPAVTRDLPEVICATQPGTTTTTMATGSIEISPSTSHCGPGNNHPTKVRIYAPLSTAQALNTDIVPGIASAGRILGSHVAASTMLTVMCPGSSSSANQGQQLVPGSPFPTQQ